MTSPDTAAAWAAVHAATPPGWFVGRPGCGQMHRHWSMHAFDPSDKAVLGHRSREWTAVGRTELHVLEQMARCLAELREGRVPR